MKKHISLTPVKASLNLFKDLEHRKLIKLMSPPKNIVATKTKTGAVSRFYSSKERFGTHTLMCVGKRTTDIKLSYHDDNEDFILINPLNLKFKKLFLIISYLKKKDFLKKFKKGLLTEKDLLAIELEFNNPLLSFWTMKKNTVHCEVTENKKGQHPVFFVTESSNLKDNKLSNKNYTITLSTENL